MTPRIALVTWSGLPGLSEDDQLLIPEFRRYSAIAIPTVWDDRTIDWGDFAAVILRSTWDYHRRREEFLAWTQRCAQATRLWNGPEAVRWNSHKSYLFSLAREGVPIVPTEVGRTGESLAALGGRTGWTELVVKPAVGANAENASYVTASEVPQFEPAYRAGLATRDLLVQPFLHEVLSPGERSLVFLEGAYSHAFVKRPALPRDLRQGLRVDRAEPSGPELAVARKAIACVPSTPLYARVDLVPTERAGPLLMELELIEPFLGFASDPASPARRANAVSDRLASP